jgi:hypothetical protein
MNLAFRLLSINPMFHLIYRLIFFGFMVICCQFSYAQNPEHQQRSESIETIIIETELEPNNDLQVEEHAEEHEEDIKHFLSYELESGAGPTLLSIEKLPYNNFSDPNRSNYKAILKWPKPLPTFDFAQFRKNFLVSVNNYKNQNPTLYYYKSKNTGKLPGFKLSKAFSASVYGTPISYVSPSNNFRNENQTYAGKNLYMNNNYWWEGSARLQVFMDLSRYLNLKNKTKILLTAGYYSSFMNIKKQDNFNGYLNNINSEGLRFHGPNYGEVNVGMRFILDRQKNKERKPPKLF